jgi:hypothetical protein
MNLGPMSKCSCELHVEDIGTWEPTENDALNIDTGHVDRNIQNQQKMYPLLLENKKTGEEYAKNDLVYSPYISLHEVE